MFLKEYVDANPNVLLPLYLLSELINQREKRIDSAVAGGFTLSSNRSNRRIWCCWCRGSALFEVYVAYGHKHRISGASLTADYLSRLRSTRFAFLCTLQPPSSLTQSSCLSNKNLNKRQSTSTICFLHLHFSLCPTNFESRYGTTSFARAAPSTSV